MSKLVLVETVSTFRHVYAVRVDDQDPADYALDDVALNMGEDTISEVAQNHIAEDIFSHRVVTEDEYLKFFDQENDYLKHWPKEKKIEFIYYKYAECENKGVNVGKEILSSDC